MPATQIEPNTMSVSVATLFASLQAAASPLRAMVLLNVVTNAVDSAPSQTDHAVDSECETPR